MHFFHIRLGFYFYKYVNVTGTFDELVHKGGHFAQLVKQLQEENEKNETGEQQAQEEDHNRENDSEVEGAAEDEEEHLPLQGAHVDFEAGVLGAAMFEEPRSRAQSESEIRRQSSARQKPAKPDANKAKLMTSEYAATGMFFKNFNK